MPPVVSPRLARLGRIELALVVALGAANVASELLPGTKTAVVAAGVVLWIVVLAAHLRADRGALRGWGLRADTLGRAAVPALLVGVPLLAAMAGWGAAAGRFPPPRGFVLILLLYPVWGVVQQFLLEAILWSNLAARLPRGAAQPLAAALFALSHLPDWPLAALTFPFALLTIEHYRRWPNLWVLGVAQGLLGTFAYYFLLGRNPLIALLP